MAGAVDALKHLVQVTNLHTGGGSRAIHLGRAGQVGGIHALHCQGRQVLLQASRVGLEVLAGAELEGIYEDAYDDPIVLFSRSANQA
jgi:hypothetical protein